MSFEYDPVKSESNKLKYGINFEEAKALWNDLERLEIHAKDTDDPSRLIIGKIDGKY